MKDELIFIEQKVFFSQFNYQSFKLWIKMSDQIADILDHQYSWKESINVLDFFIRDSNQGNL